MPLSLTWSIEGEQQLVRRLRKIGNEVKDWREAFTEASDELKEVFSKDVFRTEGAILGESWKQLKPTYLAQKVKRGYSRDILVQTGAMKSDFQSRVTKDYAVIFNGSSYFKYHQSRYPRTKIPRRVMMKLGNRQKEMVVKIFHTYWYKKTH